MFGFNFSAFCPLHSVFTSLPVFFSQSSPHNLEAGVWHCRLEHRNPKNNLLLNNRVQSQLETDPVRCIEKCLTKLVNILWLLPNLAIYLVIVLLRVTNRWMYNWKEWLSPNSWLEKRNRPPSKTDFKWVLQKYQTAIVFGTGNVLPKLITWE